MDSRGLLLLIAADSTVCAPFTSRRVFLVATLSQMGGLMSTKTASLMLALLAFSCAAIPSPNVRPFDDSSDWILTTPLTYEIGETRERITVPAGFVTDFASVPRGLCTLLPGTGTYLRAAIVHDFLYWDQTCTKDEADAILRAAMIESDVSPWKREAIYAGVQLGGSRAWQSNTQDRAQNLIRVLPSASRRIPRGISWYNYRRQLSAAEVKEPSYQRPARAACVAYMTVRP